MMLSGLVVFLNFDITEAKNGDDLHAGDVSTVELSRSNGVISAQSNTPTGTSYLLFEEHGGDWTDAEKQPPDDGPGNPGTFHPNEEDDLLCWAFTAANILEWTGWGFVSDLDSSDDIADYFENHVTDYPGEVYWGLEWWFKGNLTSPAESVSIEDVEGVKPS